MNNIKVLIVEPNKEPYSQKIEHTLKKLQHIVGGTIDMIELEEDVDLICNDEGKLMNLPFNRFVGNDVIAGTFIIAGQHKGETTSLTEEQINKYKEIFSLANHIKKIEYMKAEFIETGNLAYMKFISLDNKEQNQ